MRNCLHFINHSYCTFNAEKDFYWEHSLNQSEHSIWRDLDQWECSPLLSRSEGSCQYHAVQNTGQQTRRILAQLWKYFISDWNTETLATSFYYNLKYWWIEVSVICQVLSSEFFHNKNWAYWEERLTSQRHQYDQQNISTKTGWYHIVASPALLCRKEPARGAQSPLLGAFLAFCWFFMA